MKPPFNYSKAAVAIGAAFPLIFREPVKPTAKATTTMNACQHMTEAAQTQPAPEIEATDGNGEPVMDCNDEATGEIVPEDQQFIKAAIIITIGLRLIEARELCGLSQSEAAGLLGVPLKILIRHERTVDRQQGMSLSFIQRAAEVYEVSLDFLFGASDDWETGSRMTQERAVSRWLFREFDSARCEQMAELRRIHNRIELLGGIIRRIAEHGDLVVRAFDRFRELNPAFEDARGGANVESSIDRLFESSESASRALYRFHMEIGIAVEGDDEKVTGKVTEKVNAVTSEVDTVEMSHD